MTDKILKNFDLRLTRLEEVVFKKTTSSCGIAKKSDNFSGPSGGLRYLLSRGFFLKSDSLRTSEMLWQRMDITTSLKLLKHP